MKTLQRAVYEEQLCDSILESRYSDLEKVSEELTNAFWRREVHPGKLCRAAVHILQEDTKFGNLLESSWQTDLDTFAKQFSYKTVVQFLVKPLFQALLRTSFVRDVRVEKLLTYARSMYLDKAINSHDIFDDVDHKGVTALACNAYFSGYIFYESAKDSLNVEILIYNLEANTNEHLDAFLVALVACFRPLNSLKFRDRIKTAPWFGNDEFMRDVLKLQIENTEREFELSQTIIEATPIEKGVSAQVKAQYEESPYPPWTNFVRSGPIPPNELLNSAGFRFNGERFGNRDEIDVLVAGCGTGSTAIFIATAWTRARVTGLDLSRASLSYAMRCAEELGVSGIRFVQGDILRISELKQNFDYIDCSGVLHHLENPIEGLRSLVEICRPGGLIRVLLYSKKSRHSLAIARPIIRNLVKNDSLEEIRRARYEYLQIDRNSKLSTTNAQNLYAFNDFFNLSMFRDLLFHTQEREFDIPQIFELIQQLKLNFCGFFDPDGKIRQGYRSYAPDDPQGLNPQSWNDFEKQSPESFSIMYESSAMYDFLVQKPLA